MYSIWVFCSWSEKFDEDKLIQLIEDSEECLTGCSNDEDIDSQDGSELEVMEGDEKSRDKLWRHTIKKTNY